MSGRCPGPYTVKYRKLTPGTPLPEVLQEMRRSGSHLGRVRDGDRVVGLVALEDVLEQLIGDVRTADVPAPATGAQTGAGAGGR